MEVAAGKDWNPVLRYDSRLLAVLKTATDLFSDTFANLACFSDMH